MLDLNPDIICELIYKVREFHAKEGVSIPETDYSASPAEETDPMQVLADHQGDLTYREIRRAILDLEPDQQANLLALQMLGQGDYTSEEWDTALAEAKKMLTPEIINAFLHDPQISDYWEEGLSMLNYSCSS